MGLACLSARSTSIVVNDASSHHPRDRRVPQKKNHFFSTQRHASSCLRCLPTRVLRGLVCLSSVWEELEELEVLRRTSAPRLDSMKVLVWIASCLFFFFLSFSSPINSLLQPGPGNGPRTEKLICGDCTRTGERGSISYRRPVRASALECSEYLPEGEGDLAMTWGETQHPVPRRSNHC